MKPEEIQNRINAIQAMLESPGWAYVLENIEGNVSLIKDWIADKRGPDKITGKMKELTDEECDNLRTKKSYLSDLKDTPANLIEMYKLMLTPEEEEGDTNPDPFFDTAEEIVEAAQKERAQK